MPCISHGYQHLGAVFKKRFFSAAFPWLMGRAASPLVLFLRARIQIFKLNNMGYGPPGLPEGSAQGVGQKGAQSRGHRLLSVGVSCSAHPAADSLVMLALCFSPGHEQGPGRTDTALTTLLAGRRPCLSTAEGPALGLSLLRQALHWYRTAPLLTAPWPAPHCPPLALRGCKNPA